MDRGALDQWVNTAANAVTAYFDRFPVKQLALNIHFDAGDEVHDGVTTAGRRIDIHIGRNATAATLGKDWMLTHEMFHLAFPSLDEDHHWMEEGLSTYLEPIARVRIGNLTAQQLWLETVQGMPDALPGPGDQGLNRTHTWGRTYWGGALFWLLADIGIRQQSHNQKSLGTAIRAVLDAGGDGSADWPASRILFVGDRATNTTVLRDLYAEMALHPTATDLAALWKSLGVIPHRRRGTFDDTAPLADIRKAITAKTTGSP